MTQGANKGWQYHYEMGKRAYEEKNYDRAQESLEQVAAEKDNFADVFNMLGLIYYHKGRFDDAVKSFKRAVEINPNYTEASLNLSVVYNETGEIEGASKAYMIARGTKKDTESYLDPYASGKLANMHAQIAGIYKDLGCYDDAADEYRKALKLRPEFADLRTELGAVYRDMKDYESAVKELVAAVKANENYPPSRIQLGLTYYLMGSHEMAKAEWEKVLAKRPDDRMARMYLRLLSGRPK